MKNFVFFVPFVVALAGCASSGPTGREVLNTSLAPQKSRIVIYRESAFGMAVQPDYVVNGKAVAPSTPHGFVVCDVAPGPHQISVGNFELNVNLGGGSDQAKVNLKPGQTAYFKAEPQMGLTLGVVTLSEVTENQGRSDTAGLHKLDGTCA